MENFEIIKFVNFQFVDILGRTREKLVPVSIAENYFESGLSFDGSSVLGYTDISCSDLVLQVDKNYIYNLPQNKKIVFCEADYKTDSRKVLKKAISEFENMGLNVKIGAELEFFVFDKIDGKIVMENLDNKSYLATLSRKMTRFFEKVLIILENLKFNVECVHHECGSNQYELDFKFDSPLEIADKVILIKDILKDVAEKTSLYVSFMPKPIKNMAGSGMHINLSVFKGEENIFNDKNGNLSNIAKQFMNGIFAHINSITAFANPTINSYKRLNSGYESPNKVFWSENDRSALIRVPKAKGVGKRIELRSPDICCNPYLTFSAIMFSGLDGIKSKKGELKNFKRKKLLPESLEKSLENLRKDKAIKNYMGEVCLRYISEKKKEIEEYKSEITDWEIKKYL